LNKIIYSIGTSTRKREYFLKLLKESKIEAVVDVRRFPISRINYFLKQNLSSFLEKNRIKYFYLGELLGGFRFKGYKTHIKSEEFLKGVNELEKVASNFATVFMCAERLPFRCHRKFIALKLEESGWRVIHILDEGKSWERKKKK
jgi:uncharacterized protein (DUF488 family)